MSLAWNTLRTPPEIVLFKRSGALVQPGNDGITNSTDVQKPVLRLLLPLVKITSGGKIFFVVRRITELISRRSGDAMQYSRRESFLSSYIS